MPSPSKRRRSDFDRETEKGTISDEDSDVEMRIEDQGGVISTVATDGSLGKRAMRPMKPLRQPSKSLMPKTHPAAEVIGLLRFHGKADIVTSKIGLSGEGGSTASDDSPLYSMNL
ncbi:hypothetical protein SERLA73DRAFT_172407 [Serpula lacrymans var. lacrymans S7.3]|uniref:Uncharacterized protein n=2 Tax=Serpula lacrymans var. lacrymans TaxID=341189 RepID=F8QF94_SERL3|nr:uncharacterized protein SERLADRAFT_447110 [Serpula lacrymans var. lacrymans S7.9]EGN93053.1 hypothetical protein SERLA73DRAFT_172407 [Serpula lacrymans var. lacrymans S7.3]EGO27890.1 hypothetical protein SERLADRAFT_447110 [Serpula lacrymans var. lacrymans S7.9]